METALALESFSLPGAALHIPPCGDVSLLRGDAIKAHLRRLPEGHLLGAFPVSTAADLHPELWEMHPEGDEILIMLTGALSVEYADGVRRDSAPLQAGHAVVVPRGVWHRLLLQEPGLLLALSPPQGTRLCHDPGREA